MIESRRLLDDISYMNKYINLFREVFDMDNIPDIKCIVKNGKVISSIKVEFYDDEFYDNKYPFFITCTPYTHEDSTIEYMLKLSLTRKSQGTTYVSNELTTWIDSTYFDNTIRSINVQELVKFSSRFSRWNTDWITNTKCGYKTDEILVQHELEQKQWQVDFNLLFI